MNLKSTRRMFWLTTTLFCATMALSAVLYLTDGTFKERFAHLGFPPYFRVELAFFKLVGVFTLLLPVRSPMKEWAYAGFFVTLFSACLAHLESGDSVAKALNPVLTAVLLGASYLSYRKISPRQHFDPASDKEK